MNAKAPLGDCWLWLEHALAGRVRWLTPRATGTVASRLGPDPLPAHRAAELRDGYQGCALEAALPEPMAAVLAGALEESAAGLRLHLAENLPEEWQRFPFEWCSYRGERLDGRLWVERYSDHPVQGVEPPYTAEGVVLNLWPPAAPVQPWQAWVEMRGVQVEHGVLEAEACIETKALSNRAMLCVLGHGTEQARGPPLRDEDHRPWWLPADQRLPPLVLLLVCGTEDGNMMAYGRRLLAQGARTVLAPIGRLDAAAVGEFMSAFWACWRTGRRVDECLQAAQALPGAEHAARRLRLLGTGALRLVLGEFGERPCSRLCADAAAGQQAALAALVDRITLRCYQEAGDVAQAVYYLYRDLGIDYDDLRQEAALFDRLAAVEKAVWPLSRAWLLPFLSALAEVHDHARMRTYEMAMQCMSVTTIALPESPMFFFYRAKPFYRQGLYARAVKELVTGCGRLSPDGGCDESGIALLGHLLNQFIDLALPEEAQHLADLLQHCLTRYAGIGVEATRFTQLDREARLALRQGGRQGISRALGRFKSKRQEALRQGYDGSRELGWLLYVSAWGRPQQAPAYAQAVKALLRDVGQVQAALGPGNADPAYLLRALALWAWRGPDGEAAQLVSRYAELIGERAHIQDPGPFAFTVAFVNLYQGMGPDDTWFELEARLEAQHYWLELAALNYLLAQDAAVARCLSQFQRQRRDAFQTLETLPNWLAAALFAGAGFEARVQALADREERERRLFLAPTSPSRVQALVDSGWIPQ